MTMNSQPTTAPKKRLTAVAWLAVAGSKKPAKFSPICRPIDLAGELDRRKHQAHREAERQADQHLLHHQQRRPAGESSATGGIAGSEACAASAIRKASADAHAHRHGALREHRQPREQRQHAQERPQQRA